MKKYWLMFIALFLLIADVRIGVLAYPAFQEFRTEAPKTVDMVVNHVIGDTMMVDVLSDAVGFALAAVATIIFIGVISKDNNISPDRSARLVKSMKTARNWAIAGFLIYIGEKLMPFFLNGNYRFRVEYGLYFLLLAAEVMVLVSGGLTLCKYLDNSMNHTYNNLSTIFAMISIGTFTVARVLYFYDLIIVFVIYYVLSVGFFIVAAYRLKKFN